MHVARMVDPELQAKEIYNWQMVNYVYGGGQPLGPQYEKVLPIINRLQPRALIRIKANLNHHTDKLQKYDFHTDCGEYGSNEFEGATTAIYYLMTIMVIITFKTVLKLTVRQIVCYNLR